VLRYDPQRDAYAILGVRHDASREEVEAAYREAARRWHPDKSVAPDAGERFHDVREAAAILRDPAKRREYDHLRVLHLGPRARPRPKQAAGPAREYAPLRPPPDWMADHVRVHFDAALLTLQRPRTPRPGHRAVLYAAFTVLGAALVTSNLMAGALALVLFMIAGTLAAPPHDGVLRWAKIAPGRKVAEFHSLDQRVSRYDRIAVPFEALSVAVAMQGSRFLVLIRGFPHEALPVLLETSDLGLARRCAREAGAWLDLPLAA